MLKYLLPLFAATGLFAQSPSFRSPGPVIISTQGGVNQTIITNGIDGNTAASIAATNVSQGYAFGVTMPTITNNTTGSADRLTSLIAAFYVTNYTENRDSIYVTGADAAAVNGQYKVS